MFKPEWEEKNWGRVLHIFCSDHAAVSCLEVNEGQRCSCHRHVDRANMFCVLDGCVLVEQWADGLDQPSKTSAVFPGMVVSVPSGVYHRFRVLLSGRVVEVYWADKGGIVAASDIERLDVGGPDPLDNLATELRRKNLEGQLVQQVGKWKGQKRTTV